MRAVTLEALKLWEDVTCLQFREVSRGAGGDHLAFDMRDDACYSNVGRVGGGQRVNIGPNCLQVSTEGREGRS